MNAVYYFFITEVINFQLHNSPYFSLEVEEVCSFATLLYKNTIQRKSEDNCLYFQYLEMTVTSGNYIMRSLNKESINQSTLKERDHLKDVGLDGMFIFKIYFRGIDVENVEWI